MAHWLRLHVEPAPRLTAFGPGWAAICGAVASGGLVWSSDALLTLALAVVLVDPLLQGVWGALEALAAAKIRWSGLPPDDLLFKQTDMTPDPGREYVVQVPHLSLSRIRFRSAWNRWQKTIWPALLTLVGVPPLVAVIVLQLGRSVPLLVTLSAILVLIVLLLCGPESALWRLARASVEVGLGWAIGYSVMAASGWVPPPEATIEEMIAAWWALYKTPATVGALFVLSHAAWLALSSGTGTWRIRILNAGQVGVAAVFVLLHQPLAASGIALAAAGQALFQPWIGALGPAWYVQRTQWFLMAGMLIAALGITLQA